MTHTPGPWIVHISPAERFTETLTGASHYAEEYVAVVSSSGTVICDNAQYYSCSLDPNNARLIAAAPELLEALEDMKKWVAAFAYGQSSKSSNVHAEVMKSQRMQKAMYAIAKATGETE